MGQTSQPSLFDPLPESDIDAAPLDIVSLATIRGLGFHSLRKLAEHFKRLSRVWEASADEIEAVLHSAKVPAAGEIAQLITTDCDGLRSKGEAELRRLSERRIAIVSRSDPLFPDRVKDARPGVYWLFVEGEPSTLQLSDTVGVVGTRKASNQGKAAATRVAWWLARRGLTIVSGLAEGIDAAAQQVAVDAGQPTIAVLGHGLSIVFPASTARLRQEIVRANGAVVAEYLPSERYDRSKFIARNRIQAALSGVLVPVEADYGSGTARTVRFAHEYGRRLVGVRLNGEAGVHRLLAELAAPIIDLTSSTANAEFAEILSETFQRPVPVEAQIPTSQLLSRLVEEFHDLVDRYPIKDEDLDALTERLRAVLREASSSDAD